MAAALAAAVVLASCSVNTPRNGFSESQQVVSGSRSKGESTSTSLAPGETVPAGSDTGTPAAGGIGGSTTGGTRTAAGATATTVAPSGGPTVGVTDKTITISAMGGFTGQYGPIVDNIYETGFAVWVKDVNDHGGINGRQIISKKVDTKDTVEGGVAACKQIQTNGSYLALSIVGFGGADVASVDCLDKAGITTLAFNLSSFNNNWQHTYSAGDPFKVGMPLASFIKNVLGERDKVGIIYIQNDPVNRAARGGLVAGMKEIGMTPIHEEQIATGQGSFVAEINRMRASGATTVAMMVGGNEAVGILRDAKAVGYSAKWTGLYWTSDDNSQSGAPLMQGSKAVRHWASVDSPAYKGYLQKTQEQQKHGVINSSTLALYGMGLITGKALQNAGTSPTVASLGAGIESIVNYDDGIWHLSFGKGVKVADIAVWPMECCNSDTTWHGTGPAKTRF
jgi:ABC-type branched-subunit amino acid transport system substrate-binding protein